MWAASGHGKCLSLIAILRAKPIADQVAELGDRGIGNGVVGGGTLGTTDDNPGGGKEAKVLADVGLAHLEAFDKLADVQFSLRAKRLDNAEPAGVAEYAEPVGHVFEELRW